MLHIDYIEPAYFMTQIIALEVVFLIWIGVLIFGTNANINLLGLLIQNSSGAIFYFAIKGHFEVI